MILKEEVKAIVSNAILKEERGVAARKYNDVADEIIQYLNDYIEPGTPTNQFNKDENGRYTLMIPEEITNKIDFIDGLTLIVTLDDAGRVSSVTTGTGVTKFTQRHFMFKDGEKLPPLQIEVNGYYYNGEVLMRM